MEQRAPGTNPTAVTSPQPEKHHASRGAWVITAYAISGLAMLGVVAYYFSDFVTH
jgi:hypothetical protein